jgi:hypothetical protein
MQQMTFEIVVLNGNIFSRRISLIASMTTTQKIRDDDDNHQELRNTPTLMMPPAERLEIEIGTINREHPTTDRQQSVEIRSESAGIQPTITNWPITALTATVPTAMPSSNQHGPRLTVMC